MAQKQKFAVAPDVLEVFLDKEYRDSYLQSQVRIGIAYQMQALRAKLGVTQSEMAEKIGKPQSVVSRLEDEAYGKVSAQTLLDVASALDVALIVQFVSYPEFLHRTEDVTEEALQPETIQESVDAAKKKPDSKLKMFNVPKADDVIVYERDDVTRFEVKARRINVNLLPSQGTLVTQASTQKLPGSIGPARMIQ